MHPSIVVFYSWSFYIFYASPSHSKWELLKTCSDIPYLLKNLTFKEVKAFLSTYIHMHGIWVFLVFTYKVFTHIERHCLLFVHKVGSKSKSYSLVEKKNCFQSLEIFTISKKIGFSSLICFICTRIYNKWHNFCSHFSLQWTKKWFFNWTFCLATFPLPCTFVNLIKFSCAVFICFMWNLDIGYGCTVLLKCQVD